MADIIPFPNQHQHQGYELTEDDLFLLREAEVLTVEELLEKYKFEEDGIPMTKEDLKLHIDFLKRRLKK